MAENKNTEMIPGANNKEKAGPLNGKLSNYISRLETQKCKCNLATR